MQGELHADVIRDGTIGPGVSVQPSGPNFEIPENSGELQGANLFHSFREFSLTQNQSATFTGTSAVQNIIGRITGGDASHIDGLLRSTVPGANLYLMNPHGVIFGEHAQLDVRGAFHASTGKELVFADGAVFTAELDGGVPILSPTLPEQFGFLGPSAAPIELFGSTLRSAHDVTLSAGTVALHDGARIDTTTETALAAADITLTGIEGVSLAGLAGNGSGSGLDAGTQSDGAAGSIRIEAPLIELRDGAWMAAGTTGPGNGGALLLAAGERLSLSGQDGQGMSSTLRAPTEGDGHAGTIRLDAPYIEFGDGAYATTATAGAGNGGELLVNATTQMVLSGKDSDGLGSHLRADTTAGGQGGTIRAAAPMIEIRDGAYITANTEGTGNAGDILVTATQQLTLSGTDDERFGASLQANALRESDGAAGNILAAARVIELQDGAFIQSNTAGSGDGGNLQITATERLRLTGTDDNGFGSGLETTASGTGRGGTLHVEAPVVELQDGAFFRSDTAGSGLGGALRVSASERLTLSGTNDHGLGSSLTASAHERGDSVGIEIEAAEIMLTDGASIESTSVGTGDAGLIDIKAGDTLFVNRSSISTRTLTAAGGNIDIRVNGLTHFKDSEISTSVRSGPSGGGNIAVNSDGLIVNRSRIIAQADAGNGGVIQLSANRILTTADSIIDASAGPAGIDGHVIIAAQENELTENLALPAVFLDSDALLQPACEARAQGSPGSLHIARQQGLPLSPERLLLAFDTPAAIPRQPAAETPGPNVIAAMRRETLRGIAIKQQTEGRYGASLKTLNTVLAEHPAQQPRQTATTLGSAANAYLALGMGETALAYFNQAISAAAADDHNALATLYNNLGNLHMVRRDFAAASAAYRESVRRARLSGDIAQEVKALSNGARAALAEKRHPHAAALQHQARNLSQKVSANQDKAYILIHLAKTAQQLSLTMINDAHHHLAAAYSDLRIAAMLSDELNDERTLSYALGNLGGLYQHRNRLEEALYLTRLAQQTAERANAPESQYRWHWQAGQIQWAQGQHLNALRAYRRAIAILEDSRPETLAQYNAAHAYFRQAVAPVYLEFVDTLLQYSSWQDNPDALLLEARATVEQLKAAELRDYFRDECITELEAKNTRLENVSATAAIVYPIILPQRLELLVSLPDGLRRHVVAVEAATLTQAIHEFRTLVETRGREDAIYETAQHLYRWLVSPYDEALKETGIDTLVFVPHGLLRTMPFAALHDGRDYLIRRYGVVVTPGLSLTDPRPLDRQSPRVLLAGLSDAVQNYPPLPHVPQELARVQDLFGGRLLLNQDFTRPQVEKALQAPVSIVHLASHAQITGSVENNYLLTHDGRLSMDQLGDILQVTRFRDQPLELLVLSACQTAVGDDRAAMGLAGIGLKAGARSAVGSLWFISDEGTSELMSGFYTKLKDPMLTKAQALQQAQQAMLDEGRFAHPYYWSPFLLMNNWL